MHSTGPFPVAGIDELLAESGGATKVDAQDRVAAIGKPLMYRVVSPVIPGPRSAVHEQDHWQASGIDPDGGGEIADQLTPITGVDDDRLHLRQRKPFELTTVGEKKLHLHAVAIVEVIRQRAVVPQVGDGPYGIVAAAAGDGHLAVGDLREKIPIPSNRVIENQPFLSRIFKGDGLGPPSLGVNLDAAQVRPFIGSDKVVAGLSIVVDRVGKQATGVGIS